VRLLPDTHTALWWLADDQRLSARVVRSLESGEHDVLVSAVVAWEIAIKRSLGKLEVDGDVTALLVTGGARPLPITLEHAAAVGELPCHHRDPFDRLLVAQAQLEGAVIVSAEGSLRAYGVRLLW